MELQELTKELIQFMAEAGQYQDFLDWAEDRGFDAEELEKKMDELEEL